MATASKKARIHALMVAPASPGIKSTSSQNNYPINEQKPPKGGFCFESFPKLEVMFGLFLLCNVLLLSIAILFNGFRRSELISNSSSATYRISQQTESHD